MTDISCNMFNIKQANLSMYLQALLNLCNDQWVILRLVTMHCKQGSSDKLYLNLEQ